MTTRLFEEKINEALSLGDIDSVTALSNAYNAYIRTHTNALEAGIILKEYDKNDDSTEE